mmetsp:Transcript_40958/g.82441  ORF Transcript_40958/g.82441 Transcript_40958/m.82441 type:complete len:98 (+) Transcript_40958:17-310(+)
MLKSKESTDSAAPTMKVSEELKPQPRQDSFRCFHIEQHSAAEEEEIMKTSPLQLKSSNCQTRRKLSSSESRALLNSQFFLALALNQASDLQQRATRE